MFKRMKKGNKRYAYSPTGSLPPSPLGTPPLGMRRSSKGLTGSQRAIYKSRERLRKSLSSLSLNRMWRR